MPRQRKLVTEKIDAGELHRSAISSAIKLHSPYEVVDAELIGRDEHSYYVVYSAPLGGDRKIIAGRNKHANAIQLRNMLSEAWAEGYWSSGRH